MNEMPKQKLSTAFCLQEIKRFFGRPPVLSSEDENDYYQIICCLLETERPEDFFGLLLVKSMVDEIWEAKRCQRYKIMAIEFASRKDGREPTEQDQSQALRDNAGYYAALTDMQNRANRMRNSTFVLWRRYRPYFPIRGIDNLQRF